MPRTYRFLAALYAILVIVLSSWPSVHLPNVGTSHLDKILHFGQYAVLAFLAARGWGGGSWSQRSARRIGILLAILFVFAAVDEYHQGWIPGRDPDWQDFLADAVGIGVGFWIGLSRLLCRGVQRRSSDDAT